MNKTKDLTEEQLSHIESLVKSPVYGSLKALFENYRQEALSQLMAQKDTAEIYRIQGRIAAINAMENLPMIRAQLLEVKRKVEKQKEDAKDKESRQREALHPRRSV